MNLSLLERFIVTAAIAAITGSIFLIFSNNSILILPLWVIFGNLSLGIYILFSDFRKEINRFFSFFVFSIVIWSLGVFIIYNVHDKNTVVFCGRYLYLGVAFIPSTFLAFTNVFPGKNSSARPMNEMLIFMPGIFFSILLFTPFFIKSVFYKTGGPGIVYGPVYPLFTVYIIVYFALGFFKLINSYMKVRGIEKTQLKYLIAGLLVTVILAISTNLILPLFNLTKYNGIGPLFSFAIVSVMSYAILKNKLIDLSGIIQKGIIYLFASIFIVAIYSFVLLLFGQSSKDFAKSEFLIALILAAFVISITFQPIFEMLQRYFSRIFFKNIFEYQEIVQKVSHAVSSAIKFDEIVNLVIPAIVDLIDPSEISFLLIDKTNQKYKSLPLGEIAHHRNRYKILEITDDSAIAAWLKKGSGILIRAEIENEFNLKNISDKLEAANLKKGLSSLDAEIFVPVILKRGLVGMIMLGAKKSGKPYGPEDVNILNALAGHIALSYENANLYEEILNIKNYNEMILNSMSSPIIATNLKGEVITLNSSAERIFGKTAREMPPAGYLDVFEKNGDILKAIEKGLDGSEYLGIEGSIVSSDNSIISVSINTNILRDIHGKKVGLLVVIHDLTNIKKLEEHLRRADKLAALGTMAAGMAHEIKNPLSSMKVLTQLLAGKFNEIEYRKKFTDIMPKEINRIDRIVESLLGYAKTNSPKIEQIYMNEIIKEALEFLDQKILRNGINVNLKFSEIPVILGDPQQFLQVFVNLILNAVQSMGKGGDMTILTRFDAVSNYIVIEVSDTGCGITKEDLQHLFDPFFTTKYEGTGLGLTIVHGIIDSHSGMIEVESRPNQGSLFRVLLPA